jgi:hypothetical protein
MPAVAALMTFSVPAAASETHACHRLFLTDAMM